MGVAGAHQVPERAVEFARSPREAGFAALRGRAAAFGSAWAISGDAPAARPRMGVPGWSKTAAGRAPGGRTYAGWAGWRTLATDAGMA